MDAEIFLGPFPMLKISYLLRKALTFDMFLLKLIGYCVLLSPKISCPQKIDF